jgi:hypothetical protein
LAAKAGEGALELEAFGEAAREGQAAGEAEFEEARGVAEFADGEAGVACGLGERGAGMLVEVLESGVEAAAARGAIEAVGAQLGGRIAGAAPEPGREGDEVGGEGFEVAREGADELLDARGTGEGEFEAQDGEAAEFGLAFDEPEERVETSAQDCGAGGRGFRCGFGLRHGGVSGSDEAASCFDA